MTGIKRENWIWYIVVDDAGNVSEAFNSRGGAEGWQEQWGGIVLPVKEVKEETE